MTSFEAVSLVVSWLAVAIAVRQLRSGTLQQRRQAAFDHIREIASTLQLIRGEDPGKLRQAIADFYDHKLETLPQAAGEYLQLLDALDLLGLAYKKKAVDRDIVSEYIRSFLLNPNTLNRKIFVEIRTKTGVQNDYEHLEYLVSCLEKPSVREWLREQPKHPRRSLFRKNSTWISATPSSAANTEPFTAATPKGQVAEASTQGTGG